MFAGERLPGIGIETARPARANELPRMDIAVFAGFAERGPCHVAIAIDSVAAYQAAFGGDAPLAWDGGKEQVLTANLAPAVRAFFSNGGTRCWVIRLCETRELAALRAAAGADAGEPIIPAEPGRFLIAGLLSRRPSADAAQSHVEPAMLHAASPGSWSDGMRLSARVERQPFQTGTAERVRRGLRVADPGLLRIGDLIELSGGDGRVTRYAKIVRLRDGWAWGAWVASFAPLDHALPEIFGLADIAGGLVDVASRCEEDETCRVTLLADAAPPQIGRWLRFTREGEAIWLKVDRVDGASVEGRAWHQIGSRLPSGRIRAARVTLAIREASARGVRIHEGLGLGAEAANAAQALIDDDLFYAATDRRTAVDRPAFALPREEAGRIALGHQGAGGFEAACAAFGTPGFAQAQRVALRSAWLPIGLDAQFGPEEAALPDAREPIERDGLARLDARYFLDPRLAEASARTLADRAQEIRFGGTAPLMGIHAALDIAGESFPEASILALPDAAQPGWERLAPADPLPAPQPGAPVRADWVTHRGGCPPETIPATLAGPDRSHFLDAATELLTPPALIGPQGAVEDGVIALRWAPQGSDTLVVLEEATRPDFADAAVVLSDSGIDHRTLEGRTEGAWYYRLHIERDGNVSAYAAIAVAVRHSRYRTLASPDPATLRSLHMGAIRLAGGSGEFFALLSLPRAMRAGPARSYATSLAQRAAGAGSAGQLGADEQRHLSYCALYHPWLVGGGSTPGDGSCVPDGAVAGLMAARARERGPWIAPANMPLADVTGLDPVIAEADLLSLDRARINVVRRLPRDFAILDADTPSDEGEWRQVNVRRLMQLLRRMATRYGQQHVFEPNGPVVRRAIEHGFTAMLNGLQQRGAFAGARSDLSFRVSVRDDEDGGDRDAGRLITEIAVAPSQPMRFLTVRLVQQGARLALVEEA